MAIPSNQWQLGREWKDKHPLVICPTPPDANGTPCTFSRLRAVMAPPPCASLQGAVCCGSPPPSLPSQPEACSS